MLNLLYYFVMEGKRQKIGLFRLFLIIVLFPLVICWVIYLKFKNLKSKTSIGIDVVNMSQIDSLSGVEFENMLVEIFQKQGYNVSLTKKSHDYGGDLVLKKSDKISIVQAKRYEKNIGIKAIQEIISAKKHYQADELFVVTNRYFSKDAIVLASEHDVMLIDRDVLTNLVGKYMPKINIDGKKYIATNELEKQKIQQKYKYWI